MLSIEITKRAALTASCLVVSCCFLGGCAGGGTRAGSVDAERYPDWVLVVPAATDGVSYFVGGCTMASSASEGVEQAKADALEQVAGQAASRFAELFDRVLLETRTQTTSTERYLFKTDGTEAYARELRAVAQVQDSYFRPCPGASPDGPVCNVFVLVSVEGRSSDTALVTALDDFRKALRDEGSVGLADIAERMQRLVAEPSD